jgi:ribonucleoside-diphosphate reductase beta chain
MNKIITSTDFFNPNGVDDGKIIGGDPTGFVDFNDTTLPWVTKMYDLMSSLMWFPSEIDCSNEAKSFQSLMTNEQMIYKLVLANLSFLDSSQEQNILNFRQNTSHKLLQSALTYQSMTEGNHSKSYAVVLAEIGNSEEVFQMYRTESVLMDRNRRVADLFAKYINGNSADKMICSAMSSVLLEGLLFMTSFSYIYILGDKMQGSSSMVTMINKDEYSHQVMFQNIFRNLMLQNNPSKDAVNNAISMMVEAVSIELDFARHISTHYPILGITLENLEKTINNYANDRLIAIGLERVFPSSPETSLQKLVKKFSVVNDTKSNFFESSIKGYSKDSISFDDI